jgi:hypothetical protein
MSTGNTRYGAYSLQRNTATNSNSSAFGLCALRDSTNLNNTAVGAYSGTYTTTGQSNASLGTNSLLRNTTGSYNTALGTGAMCFNEIGNNNTAIGSNALENNTGDSNTAVGTSALFANTTGTRNTAVGKEALIANTGGAKNTAIGQLALKTNTTGSQNVAVGDLALQLNNSANDNVAVGFHSLFNSTGGSNIGVGSYTLSENTGVENVAIGHASLSNKTTGNGNVSVGAHSLEKNLTENENTAIGYYALYNNTSGKNTALGSYALQNSTTCNNSVALGFNAMKNGNANQSVAIGSQAAESSSGTLNVSVGRLALFSNTTGGNNVAIGGNAGYTVTTGANNTFLGCQADVTTNSISNSTAIGYNAKANASNQIMMGTIAEQVVIPGSGVLSNTDPASYSLPTSIVPKSYVDSMAAGLAPTSSCSCATTENISLSGLQTIDGYPTEVGDRVLVKSQGATTSNNEYTSNIKNGIYIASSGNWSRATDCDNGDDVKGQITFVENGTLNGFTAFNVISSSAIVETNELAYGIFYSTNFTLKNGLEVIDSGLNIKKELSGFLNFVGINSGTNTNYSLDTGTKDALINNVTVGKGSGNVSTNTAIGFQALKNYSSGSGSNTAIGYQAGSTITSSANNTLLGYLADVTSNSINNSTAIGYNAKATASNQIMMGTATEQVFIPGRLSATGDTSLGSKLAVTGDTSLGSKLNVTGETTLNSNLIVNNGTTTLKNRLTVNTGGLSVEAGGLTVSAGGLTVSAGGLTVTSGDTTLANKLTVSSGGLTVSNGGLNITGDTILNGSTAIIRANSGSLNLQTGTTDRIIIDTNGNVGIAGPVNSSYKLNVTGATNLTSSLNVTGATTLGSTLGVTGLSTLASLSVTNNATIGGTLGVTGLSTLASLSVTNNATIGGTLGVTGATTLSSTLGVTGATTLGQNGSSTTTTTINGLLTMNGNASGKLSAYNTSTTDYQGGFYNSSIGTGNGTFLSSKSGITEIKMNNSGSTHFTISNDNNLFKINKSSLSTNPYTNDATLMSLSKDGGLILYDSSNNQLMNVQSSNVEIKNNLYARNKLYIGADNPGGGTGDNAFLEYVAPTSGVESTVLRINVNNDSIGSQSDNINLNPSGGVGIGTDAPINKLDVKGTFGVSGATTLSSTMSVSGATNVNNTLTVTGSLTNTTTIAAGTNSTQVATTAFLYSCLVQKIYSNTTSFTLDTKYMYGNIVLELNTTSSVTVNLQCPTYPNFMNGLTLKIRQTGSKVSVIFNTYLTTTTSSVYGAATNAIVGSNASTPSSYSNTPTTSYSYELIYMTPGATPTSGAIGYWYVTSLQS